MGVGTTYAVLGLLIWCPPGGLSSSTAPLIASAVAAFVVGQVMMHPISTAARACLHCFCLDDTQARELGLSAPANTPPAMLTLVETHDEHERGGRCCCF